MIVFYDKRDGRVFSVIEGRVHSEQQLNIKVSSSEIPENQVGKYVVPFEPNVVEEIVEVKELRVVDDKTKRVSEVVVGEKKEMVARGMKPALDNTLSSLILDFENHTKDIYKYRVTVNKDRTVGGFIVK